MNTVTSRDIEIEELADYISESYFSGKNIDPVSLAEKNNISYSFGDYENCFDGLLEYMEGRFHVYINLQSVNNTNDPRSRFTFAHELGHYYIEEHHNALVSGVLPHPSFTEYSSDNIIEREADLFAASLLMPRTTFLKKSKKLPLGAFAIVELARSFSTSLSSTAIRYAKTNEQPIMVMFWSKEKRLWQWASQSFNELIRGWTYKDTASIPVDTLTRQVLDKETSFEDMINLKKGSTLSTWFPSIQSYSYGNNIVIEQVVPLGRHGVLTILMLDK